jgi:acyl-CoA thioesterase-2
MQKALDDLLSLLDLEELEVNLFRARSPQDGSQRVFGGQVLGQALVAAGRTAASEEMLAHSFHAYFLRPGDPSVPILYQVDRTKDGRSFQTRRVVAIQQGRPIFHMESSFHRPEHGLEHQDAMPEVPDPEDLPTFRERIGPLCEATEDERERVWFTRDRPIDSRYVTEVDFVDPEPLPPRLEVWLRADGRLPESLLIQQCVLAYASDMTLLDTAILPHGFSWYDRSWTVASLDHAMWFHRPFRADEWLLYVQDSPAATAGRAFASGKLFTHDGHLVASVVQEGLIRKL